MYRAPATWQRARELLNYARGFGMPALAGWRCAGEISGIARSARYDFVTFGGRWIPSC